MSFMAVHASMQAWHDCAHMRQMSLWSACVMHMSMQTWHIAMQASSIAIIAAGVMPCMRIIARIVVLHMSAQFMHAGAQSIICVEQTVHACSQAEHASMHACITAMSIAAMSGIDIMSFDIAPIIIESIAHRFRRRIRGRDRPLAARVVLGRRRVDALACP